MKIFFFIHHLGNGGAERVTSTLANELASRGHEIHIGLYSFSKNSYNLSPNIIISKIEICPGILSRPKKYWAIRECIKRINPDIIIAVMPYNFMAVKIATLGLKIPIIVSDHANFRWNVNKLLKFIRFYGYRFANWVTVLSHNDECYMQKHLHNMKVMYNPLSFPTLSESTERKKNILACGRVSVWDVKGFDLLIQIWSRLAPVYSNWSLDIAGDGSEADFEHLKSIAREYGVLDRINFLGFCKNIKEVMATSSIFALSSRAEGFPCSLLEAMSQGCAPVAFSIHGIISEIITNGVDGFIVDDEDLKLFENRLAYLMDNEERITQISKAAISSMNRFEVSVVGNEWESFLKKVVK